MARSLRRACPILILGLLLAPAPASAAKSSFSPSERAAFHSTSTSSQDTKAFWTEKRMRQAEKNDLDDAGEDAPESPPDPSPPTSDGSTDAPTTTIDPTSPDGEELDTYSPTSLSDQRGDIPYTREELSDDEGSYITHGRVFFRSGGISYSCSGTVVTSTNGSVVWTAGHCVNHPGQGGWVNKWMFVPGYEDGEAPYGKWTAKSLAAPRGWAENASAAYDMGAAVLNPNAAGQRIQDVVGSQGIAWNLSRRQSFTAYGYPAAGTFDGQSLWACHSRYGWSDDIPGPNPMAIGCNLSYGSSGGGWIIELADGSYLNSVNSYSHVGQRHVMYGPYFGDAAANLYALVQD